jgi:hypothetical protein
MTLASAPRRSIANLRHGSAAGHRKNDPTFSDAIDAVRRLLWSAPNLSMSRRELDHMEIATALWEKLTETLYYAA